MSVVETTYGVARRLRFCAQAIADAAPGVVLDIGCGTGALLTRPLAERFPAVRFIGIDDDADSIAFARSAPPLANLAFGEVGDLARLSQVDFVIASEVLEHVEDPGGFLARLRNLLPPSGTMIVTLPNGRGPYEIASTLEVLLRLSGAFGVLRSLKRVLVGGAAPAALEVKDTLATSPHINFFSYSQALELFRGAGLSIKRYQPRTFLCGFVFDQIIRADSMVAWNVGAADRLSPGFASAWMFVLEPCAPEPAAAYKRGPVARRRRRLNEKCYARAPTSL